MLNISGITQLKDPTYKDRFADTLKLKGWGRTLSSCQHSPVHSCQPKIKPPSPEFQGLHFKENRGKSVQGWKRWAMAMHHGSEWQQFMPLCCPSTSGKLGYVHPSAWCWWHLYHGRKIWSQEMAGDPLWIKLWSCDALIFKVILLWYEITSSPLFRCLSGKLGDTFFLLSDLKAETLCLFKLTNHYL